MSSDSLNARTRVYLFWTKDRSTGCREVLFSGEGVTTQLVWDANRKHFSTTEVLAIGWHKGMLLGDDFEVAPVEPFLVPPSNSCLNIEITAVPESSSSIPTNQLPPLPSKQLTPNSANQLSPLPSKQLTPNSPNPMSPFSNKQLPPIPIAYQLSPPNLPTTLSSMIPPPKHSNPINVNNNRQINTDECTQHEYVRLEECYSACNGDSLGRDAIRQFSESDNYYDHLIEESHYQIPQNNQPVDDAIYKVPQNNRLVEDTYQSPNNRPVFDTSELTYQDTRKQSSDLGNVGMSAEVLAPDLDDGAYSDPEDYYQVPLTTISHPRLSQKEARIPSHYDTQDRPRLLSKTREMSKVPSPIETQDRLLQLAKNIEISKVPSPTQEVNASCSLQEISPTLQRSQLLKRGPIISKRVAPEDPPMPPDTGDRHKNSVDFAEIQQLREELLRSKTDGEIWRSNCEEANQKLASVLAELDRERAIVRKLTEELIELKTDTQPISAGIQIELAKPVPRNKAPQIIKPKPLFPKPAKRCVK